MTSLRGYHSREVVVDDFTGTTRVTDYHSVELPTALIHAVQAGNLNEAQALAQTFASRTLGNSSSRSLLPAPEQKRGTSSKPHLVELIKDGSQLLLHQAGRQTKPHASIDLLAAFHDRAYSADTMNPFVARENGHAVLYANGERIATFKRVRSIDDFGRYKRFVATRNGSEQEFLYDGRTMQAFDRVDVKQRTLDSIVAAVQRSNDHALYVNGNLGPRTRAPLSRITVGKTKIAYVVGTARPSVMVYHRGKHTILGRHASILSLAITTDEHHHEHVVYATRRGTNTIFYVDGKLQPSRAQIIHAPTATTLITPNYAVSTRRDES